MILKEKLIEFEKKLDDLGLDFVNFITSEQVFSKIRENIINSIKTELVKHELNYDNPGLGFEKYYLGDSSSPILKIIIRRTPEGKFLKTNSSINVELSIQKFKLKKIYLGLKKFIMMDISILIYWDLSIGFRINTESSETMMNMRVTQIIY